MLTIVADFIRIVSSTALQVCLNVVGALFLLELDNVIYSHALSEKMRSHFEALHHQVLTGDDANNLEKAKLAYMLIVPVGIAGMLLLTYLGSEWGDSLILSLACPPIFSVVLSLFGVLGNNRFGAILRELCKGVLCMILVYVGIEWALER
jgi:hypothetical protein